MTTGQGTDKGAPYDASTQGAPPEKANIVEDFIDIFYAPASVYARRGNAGYGLTLLIVSVLAALFAFASRDLFATAMEADMSRRMAEQMAKNPQLTAEMAQRAQGMQVTMATWISYVATPIGVVVVAALAWVAARMVAVKLTWNHAMLIVTLAWIPRLLQGLVVAAQGLLMDASSVDGMNRLTLSPSRFMSPEGNVAVLTLASRFDLFVLWTTVLLGIGIAVLGKAPRSKGFIAAAIVWGIVTLIGVVPAVLTS